MGRDPTETRKAEHKETGAGIAREEALRLRDLGVAALDGYDRVEDWLTGFLEELRTAMFLAGAGTVAEMRAKEALLLGRVREWAEQRRAPLSVPPEPGRQHPASD